MLQHLRRCAPLAHRTTRTSRVGGSASYMVRSGYCVAAMRQESASIDDVLALADDEQRRLMREECILVDAQDHIIGSASKKTCKLIRRYRTDSCPNDYDVSLFVKMDR